MLTSNVQLGYVLTRGGRQAVQGGLSCHPPAKYFAENGYAKNFITPSTTGIFSGKGYKLYFSQSEMLSSNVQSGYVLTRGGGKLSRAVYLAPRLEFQREWIIHKFYNTIYCRNT